MSKRLLAEILAHQHPAPPPEYVAIMEWAALADAGFSLSIRKAAVRWHTTEKVARRLVSEAKQVRVSLEA